MFKSQFVELLLNEEVAVLFRPPTAGNKNYMRLAPIDIFRPKAGGEWTNGIIAAPKAELTRR